MSPNPCLENPTDRGAWRATDHGVAESDNVGTKHHHVCGKTQESGLVQSFL